jgi:protein TonB
MGDRALLLAFAFSAAVHGFVLMLGGDWPEERRGAVPRYMIARLIEGSAGEKQQPAREETPSKEQVREEGKNPLPAGGSRAHAAAGGTLGAKTVPVRALVDAAGNSGRAGAAGLGRTHSGLSARAKVALGSVCGGVPSPAPGDRLAEIRRMIETHKSYPRLALRKGWEGEVIVELSLDGSGDLRDVQVVRRSGYRVLDQATLTAVRSAGPFPPLSGRVQVPVSYRIEE